ncbi:MAG: ATP-binding cassette domain-containing protein [Myxococcales bacterium]
MHGVSIRVDRGECYGLAGPNGAGKTTLIRLLLGLSTPDAGEVRLFGVRPENPEVRRRVGFVPEAAELPPSASPRQLVRRFARLRGLRDAESSGLAQLDRLGMAELLDRPAHKLSKGEKQRTLLALALLGTPELLVLDEPTDGLDPLGRALVRRVLREERVNGRTVFLNSHLLSETERICTRVGILHRGQLVREHAVQPLSEASGQSAVVLSDPPPPGFRSGPSMQGFATESEGTTILVEHDDVAQLNAALDELRASGAQIVEVRRVRQDLEATFEAAVASGTQESPADPGPVPAEAAVEPRGFLRSVAAIVRVAQEIGADLAARKVGWIALAVALIVFGLFFWVLRHDVLAGAAAAVRSFGGPSGSTDAATLAHWVGRYTGGFVYWALLPGSVIFAAMFAPPLLDPRRTILLYAQPVSRGDVACALYATVCVIVLCEYVFLVALLYGGIRWLGVALTPRFLLMVLPLLFAFAALYAIALAMTYAIRSGVAAGGAAFGIFLVAMIVGFQAVPGFNWQAIVAAFLPRVVGLAEQAGRFASGDTPRASPFVLTATIAAALFMVALFAARRSEQ